MDESLSRGPADWSTSEDIRPRRVVASQAAQVRSIGASGPASLSDRTLASDEGREVLGAGTQAAAARCGVGKRVD